MFYKTQKHCFLNVLTYNENMKVITLYHGSIQELKTPKFKFGNPHNDYGQGFYMTLDLEIAKEWANKSTTGGIVNKYKLDCEGLNILDLTKFDVLTWLAILLHNRELNNIEKIKFEKELKYLEQFYIDTTKYDIVIGYRADDAYFRFPKMFLNNEITLKSLRDIYALGNLSTQYVLISEKAFKRIKFIDSKPVSYIYYEKYRQRRDVAERDFELLCLKDRYSKDERIKDLILKDD